MDEKYFIAKIQYDLPDQDSGKIKKIREEKLVKGYSVTDVEAKVTKKYEGFTHDWRITSVSESKIDEVIEKFSVLKALQAVEKANVVIYLVDAQEGITDQDAHLLGLVLEAGRALIIGLNKWDGISTEQKNTINRQLDIKLSFVEFAEKHQISALHGNGVGKMFDMVKTLYEAAMLDMSTPNLTRMLKEAVAAHQPPMVNGRRIKLKYAHQGGRNPPIVVVHGAQTDVLPESYKRYLINYYRTAMNLSGTPIRIVFKSPVNPFHGLKTKKTEWEVKKRERLTRRSKAKSH